MTATATRTQVTDWALSNGFKNSVDNPDWLDRGAVRIAFDDNEVAVYSFDASRPQARVLDSTVTLSGSPMSMVAAVVLGAVAIASATE